MAGPRGELTGYLELALHARPELAGAEPVLHRGWDFAVLELGGWMFRFPKNPAAAAFLPVEVKLLGHLAPQLPVPVPRPRLAGVLADGLTPFSSYPKLPGEPLTAAAFAGGRAGLLASQIAGILSALHASSVRSAVDVGVRAQTPDTWRASYVALAADVERRVGPLLTPEEAARDAAWWVASLADQALWGHPLTVVHGDLCAPHLLHDPARGLLTGIIDWADARIGDVALDFAGLLRQFGIAALRRVLDCYPDSAGLLPRVAFLARVMPYWEVLYGLDTQAPVNVATGLADLRADWT